MIRGNADACARSKVNNEPSVAQNPVSSIEVIPEYEAVFKYLEGYESRPLFVTGQGGTGKSTLIMLLRERYGNIPVLAPTGVAALNVGGQTIHSFFGFKPGIVDNVSVNPRLVDMIRSLKYIIIDEISMVRADMMDNIDESLRINRSNVTRFGGVKMILIGDLFQLPPIVDSRNQTECDFIHQHYGENPFFYRSSAIQHVGFHTIELTKVFRQNNTHFINLLSNIREGTDLQKQLDILNMRCKPAPEEGVIRLVPTRRQAQNINDWYLEELPGDLKLYTGQLSGSMEGTDYNKLPAPMELFLKVGAQVMFTKNDKLFRWVNGTCGVVEELHDDHVIVNGMSVEPEVWETVRYNFDRSKMKRDENGKPVHSHECITRNVVGKYKQFPLIPAWAVTIHKSQSKTFARVAIELDDRDVFAEGQTYVALSRCKTITGIFLSRHLTEADVKVNPEIQKFYKKIRKI